MGFLSWVLSDIPGGGPTFHELYWAKHEGMIDPMTQIITSDNIWFQSFQAICLGLGVF